MSGKRGLHENDFDTQLEYQEYLDELEGELIDKSRPSIEDECMMDQIHGEDELDFNDD